MALFRRELTSFVEIDAPPERVWALLMDQESYPTWNPFIREIDGPLEIDSRPVIRLRPIGRKEMVIRPRVLAVNTNSDLRWLGRLGPPGILDGEHRFSIEPHGWNRSRFIQSERFRGLLVPLASGILDDTLKGFEEMNRALKERAEQG